MGSLALRIFLARTTKLNAFGGCANCSYYNDENRLDKIIPYIKSLLIINLNFVEIIVVSPNSPTHVFGPEMSPVLAVRVFAFLDFSQQCPE